MSLEGLVLLSADQEEQEEFEQPQNVQDQGLGFRASGLGIRDEGLGFRVEG